jgi:hypothetical protein
VRVLAAWSFQLLCAGAGHGSRIKTRGGDIENNIRDYKNDEGEYSRVGGKSGEYKSQALHGSDQLVEVCLGFLVFCLYALLSMIDYQCKDGIETKKRGRGPRVVPRVDPSPPLDALLVFPAAQL